MKKFSAMLLGLAMVLSTAAFAGQDKNAKKDEKTATAPATPAKKHSRKHKKTTKTTKTAKRSKGVAATTGAATPAPAPAK